MCLADELLVKCGSLFPLSKDDFFPFTAVGFHGRRRYRSLHDRQQIQLSVRRFLQVLPQYLLAVVPAVVTFLLPLLLRLLAPPPLLLWLPLELRRRLRRLLR